jgi:hypothetical protein
MFRRVLASAAAAALAVSLSAAALAQAPAEVYCGSFTPLKFRVAAAGKAPQDRANQAMDVINKYLGGKAPAVTTKPEKGSVKLMIQRDVVAVVTAADAKAEKQKSPTVLARNWSVSLARALKESCAQR